MMVCEKQYSSDCEIQSNLISSSKINATSITPQHDNQASFTAKGVPYYPISYYSYIYPGYPGAFYQGSDSLPGAGYDLLSMGPMESNYSSEAYSTPGYGPYADGHYFGQLPYLASPTGYFYYDPMICGKQATNPYSCAQIPVDTSNGYTYMIPGQLEGHVSTPTTFECHKPTTPTAKLSTSDTPNNLPITVVDTTQSHQTFPGSNKYQTNHSGWIRYPHPTGAPPPPSFPNEKQSHSMNSGVGHRVKSGMWSTKSSRFQLNRRGLRYDVASSDELRYGPRCTNNWKKSSSSSADDCSTTSASSRLGDEYKDVKQLKINHENARFFVIKSYSEDDIHKCIKYGVWSSTCSGNRKLNAAFHEAEKAANSECGKTCPIFLFFSVNGSGQFVGLAEMTGRVDFDKDVDFWQVHGKWNGSFTVKWHVVKDIPNSQLRHILVKSNENRPVTYSRDTQEIELKAGLEMLIIFKDYNANSSVLDDFEFYENREKALQARKKGPRLADHPTEVRSSDNLLKDTDAATEGGGSEQHLISDQTDLPVLSPLLECTENKGTV